jgi:ring-1,2-phenylacetyl-CoA epoxidase subunit PaaE
MVTPADLLSPVEALRRVRSAVAQVQRDLAMVREALGGGHPPPLVARRRTRYPEVAPPPAPDVSASAAPTRVLQVLAVREETEDAISITLRDVAGAPIGHRAGQFLTFLVDTGAGVLRRSYSISSAPPPSGDARGAPGEPAPDTATITVKRIIGGRVSTWLRHNARPGVALRAQGPQGAFVLPPRDPGPGGRVVVLYAGGSGITPCIAIARATLRDEPDARVHLVYGNRRAADVIFARDLDALVAASEGRFSVHHFLERFDAPTSAPSTSPAAPARAALPGMRTSVGRLDRGNVARALAAAPALGAALPDALLRAEHFVCGPAPMMEAVLAELRARGVADERLHAERFTSPEQRVGFVATSARADAGPQEVVVRLGGERRTLRTRAGQTILGAALEAGVPLPFSCAVGGCGACKARVVAGEVDVETPNCLTAEERAAGVVLTCVGLARSACELDFGGAW